MFRTQVALETRDLLANQKQYVIESSQKKNRIPGSLIQISVCFKHMFTSLAIQETTKRKNVPLLQRAI